MNILIVEDEKNMARGIKFNLDMEGYQTKIVENGKDAILEFETGNYDLLILDIMLPNLDGFSVAKIIKEKEPEFPILVLTAKNTKEDIVKALSLGVDDYLTKPFHLEEFLLRVKGLLKRTYLYRDKKNTSILYFGDNQYLDYNNLELKTSDGSIKRVTEIEAKILKLLIENKDKVVTRRKILETVWNTSYMETRTIDNFIVRLRKYIEIDPSAPKRIISIRGKGYCFKDTI